MNNLKNIIISGLTVAITLILLQIIIKPIGRLMPSDYIRTKFVINYLKESKDIDVVFLGNSVLMTCVDVSDLRGKCNIINAGTTGQSIYESVLLYSLLPKKISKIYQFLSIQDFSTSAQISDNVLKNFYLWDYTPPSKIYNYFGDNIYGFFKKSEIQKNFTLRNFIQNGFSSLLRARLNGNRINKDFINDMTRPNPYIGESLPEKNYQNLILKINSNYDTTIALNREYIHFLNKTINYTEKELNAQLIFVFPPINPDLTKLNKAWQKKTIASLKTYLPENTKLVNLNEIAFVRQDFYDHFHLNSEGAKKVTHYLKNEGICFFKP